MTPYADPSPQVRNAASAPLIDAFGRSVTYLRVSVTDRCDLRCVYCMSEHMTFLPKAEVLTLEELDRIASAFVGLGVKKLRITGGEPLMRKGVMGLIGSLGRHLKAGALDEITLTTNGTRLAEFAGELAAAGVRRVNVSLDTLKPALFRTLTRGGDLAKVMAGIDAAQAAAHLPVDVRSLGADFLAFSGHKVYAPTGTGVLWGRADLLNELPPWQGGGEMIKEVTFAHTTYNELPYKYEAGTPNIEGAIALAAALDYVNGIGLEAVHLHENMLIHAAADALAGISGIRFYGPADRSGSLSFGIDGLHHYDIGTLLDQMGVAVRTGHHCCQPLMARFGITGTVRASFALYNTTRDVEDLAKATEKAVAMLR